MGDIQFHKIWIEQCEGARDIKERFGLEKAIGYLVGEKLRNFLEASGGRPEWAAEIPSFVAKVRQIFTQHELRAYLENVKRLGAMGHVCTDEEYEVFREAGAVDEDLVDAAEDVMFVEQMKELLLGRESA